MKYAKVIAGNIISNPSDDYDDVEVIRGCLDCRGADAKVSFPKLKTICGDLYYGGEEV